MKPDKEGSKLERIHYHLQEASKLEHELSGKNKGEATVPGKMMYGIQLVLQKIHGDN